jgi:exodeoxyribonuclease VII large subunit
VAVPPARQPSVGQRRGAPTSSAADDQWPSGGLPDGDDPSASLTIGDLYARVDQALRHALPGQVWVSGEVRSFNVSSRGHCYLDLVDPIGSHDMGAPVLKVVCWSSRWVRVRATLERLGISLEAGLVVRVRGEVQLYKPRGDLSFILTELDTDALLGRVAAERARLVKALVDEGVFDRNRQLPVPDVPLRVGLVTSPGTEGYRDFVGTLAASGMAFDLRVVPTQVQGREAPVSVARAITQLQEEGCDVVVVVRGGGSKADLATFDTEPVARAIVASGVPVWTGIGHTGDQSVADEVANRSFITPTECGQELARRARVAWERTTGAGRRVARLATVLADDVGESLARRRRGVVVAARGQTERHAERLVHRAWTLRAAALRQVDANRRELGARVPTVVREARRSLRDRERHLVSAAGRVATGAAYRTEAEVRRVEQWRHLLAAYDYQRQLERGYSVTRDATGAVVRSVADLERGALVVTDVADGTVRSLVEETRRRHPAPAMTAGDPGDGTVRPYERTQ